MRSSYGKSRIFLAIKRCIACGVDHMEFEFKQQDDGTYRGRCYRKSQWITIDKNGSQTLEVSATDN